MNFIGFLGHFMRVLFIVIILCGISSSEFSDFNNIKENVNIPLPENVKKPSIVNLSDDMIGLNATIRFPFSMIKKLFAKSSSISFVDPSDDIVYGSQGSLVIRNMKLNINGIITEPVIMIKPYIESLNVIAIKIERFKFHLLMEADKSTHNDRLKSEKKDDFNAEDLMEKIVNSVIEKTIDMLNKGFYEKKIPLKAEKVLRMKYYKKEWILRITVSSDFTKAFISSDIIDGLQLYKLYFDNKNIYLSFKTRN